LLRFGKELRLGLGKSGAGVENWAETESFQSGKPGQKKRHVRRWYLTLNQKLISPFFEYILGIAAVAAIPWITIF
jgi:hypothetical protein